MSATKIMLIRHAEKPDGRETLGVTASGLEDRRNLTVRGWQRAGALIALFGPDRVRRSVPLLSAPTAIFASRPTANSVRPLHTVEPLAQSLSIGIDVSYGNDEEAGLAASATATDGVVLISWKRDGLPQLANAIAGGAAACPPLWPEDRFDVVWVFDRPSDPTQWTFHQVPQLLLSGDRAESIAGW